MLFLNDLWEVWRLHKWEVLGRGGLHMYNGMGWRRDLACGLAAKQVTSGPFSGSGSSFKRSRIPFNFEHTFQSKKDLCLVHQIRLFRHMGGEA